MNTNVRSEIRRRSDFAGHNSGTDISVRRSALVEHNACREGLKFFDSLVRASKKKRGTRSTRGRLDMRFTNAHAVWLAIEAPDFAAFVGERGLIPPPVWKFIDFSGMTLQDFDVSDAYMLAFEGSRFEGGCHLEDTSYVSLDWASATDCLSLKGEIGEFTAKSAAFEGSIRISLAKAAGCDFTAARAWGVYVGTASLVRAKFDRATLTGIVNFEQAYVREVTFAGAEFQQSCCFEDVVFTDVSFERAVFEEGVFFENCTFVDCDFSGAAFAGNIEFSGCKFSDCTFSDTIVHGTAVGLPAGLRLDRTTHKITAARKRSGAKKRPPAKKSTGTASRRR